MSIDGTHMTHFLETNLNLIISDVTKHRDTSLDVYRSIGLGEMELVIFVSGLTYFQLQRDFDDECNKLLNRYATKDELNQWFIPFWKTNFNKIKDELISI